MDEKLKAKWVKALRSGKYKQAREVLKGAINYEEVYSPENDYVDPTFILDDGTRLDNEEDIPIGHCCLGVLCEITPGIEYENGRYIVKSKNLKKIFGDPDDEDVRDDFNFILNHDGERVVEISGEALPAPLVKYFGMNKRVVKDGSPTDVHGKLIRMNDNGDNFEKIANYIERVL